MAFQYRSGGDRLGEHYGICAYYGDIAARFLRLVNRAAFTRLNVLASADCAKGRCIFSQDVDANKPILSKDPFPRCTIPLRPCALRNTD